MNKKENHKIIKMCFEIRENDPYFQGLNDVVKLRLQRKQIYGDGWLNDPLAYDVWMIHGKTNRLKFIASQGDNNYEKMEDTLMDLINYSLFALAKIKRNKNGVDKKQ